MALNEVSNDTFEAEVLKSDVPVIIDLWAPWCGPCKALHPILEDIANEYSDKIKIVKLNVDDNPSIAANYNVMSIPTLLFFKAGQVEGQVVGLVSKDKIIDKFSSLI